MSRAAALEQFRFDWPIEAEADCPWNKARRRVVAGLRQGVATLYRGQGDRHQRYSRAETALVLALALNTLLPASATAAEAPPAIAAQGSLQPLFAPWDNIEAAIIDVIDGARQQVLVQAYLLTSKKIATALIAAHRRGVDVNVLVDADQLEKVDSSVAPKLAASGIPVWLETKYQNAHNKVMVIDASSPKAVVMTGSFNFTWTAQHKNAENLLIARNNPALAARYAGNWERHRKEATPYKK